MSTIVNARASTRKRKSAPRPHGYRMGVLGNIINTSITSAGTFHVDDMMARIAGWALSDSRNSLGLNAAAIGALRDYAGLPPLPAPAPMPAFAAALLGARSSAPAPMAAAAAALATVPVPPRVAWPAAPVKKHECPICHDVLVNGTALECAHVFCYDCLHAAAMNTQAYTRPRCPYCRRYPAWWPTPLPENVRAAAPAGSQLRPVVVDDDDDDVHSSPTSPRGGEFIPSTPPSPSSPVARAAVLPPVSPGEALRQRCMRVVREVPHLVGPPEGNARCGRVSIDMHGNVIWYRHHDHAYFTMVYVGEATVLFRSLADGRPPVELTRDDFDLASRVLAHSEREDDE